MRISDWSSDVCSSDLRHSCKSSSSSPRSASPSVCLISARCACSLHNSTLSPMPTSTAFFSMLTALRWLAGLLIRPLLSRPEEHTFEIQSLMRISYAVYRLNKKNTHISHRHHYTQRIQSYQYNTP